VLNINFDLFYELKQGSIVSHTNGNVVKYWRLVDGNLEFKTVVNKQTLNDWQVSDLLALPLGEKFQIEQRFEKFNNG
jgi:hypothetical protein